MSFMIELACYQPCLKVFHTDAEQSMVDDTSVVLVGGWKRSQYSEAGSLEDFTSFMLELMTAPAVILSFNHGLSTPSPDGKACDG